MKRLIAAGVRTNIVVLWALLVVRPVAAHALGAECKIVGDQVEVEAYYSDDTQARDACVRVVDAEKTCVAEGRTDARGRWRFKLPPVGIYWVEVDAGVGHRTRVKVTVPAKPSMPDNSRTSTREDCPCCETAPASESISEGPSRKEFTRFPWLRVFAGLGIISALGAAAWLVKRGRFHPA
jgi:hypothetical protein